MTLSAAVGKQQTNLISVAEADYITTALHFPGLTTARLQFQIRTYNSNFENST